MGTSVEAGAQSGIARWLIRRLRRLLRRPSEPGNGSTAGLARTGDTSWRTSGGSRLAGLDLGAAGVCEACGMGSAL